jgi:hypothetical protein
MVGNFADVAHRDRAGAEKNSKRIKANSAAASTSGFSGTATLTG